MPLRAVAVEARVHQYGDAPEQEYTPLIELYMSDGMGDTTSSASRTPSRTPPPPSQAVDGSAPSKLEEQLELQVADFRVREGELMRSMEEQEALLARRLRPLEEELREVQAERLRRIEELDMLRRTAEDLILPPGPESLRCMDSAWCTTLCSGVIAANLVAMFVELWKPKMSSRFWTLDQLFLVWYLVEITLKGFLYQRMLLIGKLAVVWWNWLDLIIVVSGIFDQWLIPVLTATGFTKQHAHGFHTASLRALRFLRLFRIMRILKIVKIFIQSDLSWTEGSAFQTFIMTVIVVNSLTMGAELDISWPGWPFVENLFLSIYVFELSVRLKRWGWEFFTSDDWKWNNLDFFIVSGGVLQQWMMPAYVLVQRLVWGQGSSSMHQIKAFMKILRMVRLVRVLRLVQLLRRIKPLYRLMVGVMEAMSGIQWVLLLTTIVLYAAAIIFTNLVGHGLIYGGDPPEEAADIFSSVPESMFLLFKVMNDDQSVVQPLIDSVPVQLLFMIFMVVSNWAVLAILTSVVSDNMIAASHNIQEEDDKRATDERRELSVARLMTFFRELDTDNSGDLDEAEFRALMKDSGLCYELTEASGLKAQDLEDLFLCLSHVDSQGKRAIQYADFIDKLEDEGKTATERSMFRLEKQIRAAELRLGKRLDQVLRLLVPGSSSSRQDQAEAGQPPALGDLDSGGRRVSSIS